MNSDYHVKYVHKIRQVIQCEPHRQVTQCDCSETCPKKTITFNKQPHDLEYKCHICLYLKMMITEL